MAKGPTASQVAYCAGLFDGEGTIIINRMRPRGIKQHSPYFNLVASISNTNKAVILFLCELWGGHVIMSVKPNGNKRAAYRWAINGHKAVPFLEAVLPFLIVKRAEVQLGLEFQGTKGYSRTPRKRLSQETIDKRQAMMTRMSDLKLRVRKPLALGIKFGQPVSKQ